MREIGKFQFNCIFIVKAKNTERESSMTLLFF